MEIIEEKREKFEKYLRCCFENHGGEILECYRKIDEINYNFEIEWNIKQFINEIEYRDTFTLVEYQFIFYIKKLKIDICHKQEMLIDIEGFVEE